MITRTADGKEIYPVWLSLVRRERPITENSPLFELNQRIVKYNDSLSEEERPLLYSGVISYATEILNNTETQEDTKKSTQYWLDQLPLWIKIENYFNSLSLDFIEDRVREGVIDSLPQVPDISIQQINRSGMGTTDVYKLTCKNENNVEISAVLKVHSQIEDERYKEYIANNTQARKLLGNDEANKIFGKRLSVRIHSNLGRYELLPFYLNGTLENKINKPKEQRDEQTRISETINYLIQLLKVDKQLREKGIMFFDGKPANYYLNDFDLIELLDDKSVKVTSQPDYRFGDIAQFTTEDMIPIDLQEKARHEHIVDKRVSELALRATPIAITGALLMGRKEADDKDPTSDIINTELSIFKSESGKIIKGVLEKLLKPAVTANDIDNCLKTLEELQRKIELNNSRKLKRSNSGKSNSGKLKRPSSNRDLKHSSSDRDKLFRTRSVSSGLKLKRTPSNSGITTTPNTTASVTTTTGIGRGRSRSDADLNASQRPHTAVADLRHSKTYEVKLFKPVLVDDSHSDEENQNQNDLRPNNKK